MKLLLQKRVQVLVLIIVLSMVGYALLVWQKTLVIRTAQGDSRFTVEIADTPEAETRGLMFRTSLAADHGMLFLFSPPQDVAFWMKNTLIPLDMFFIRPDGAIARIEENATPKSLALIRAGSDVAAVLEVPGGTAKRIGAHAGDRVINWRFHHE